MTSSNMKANASISLIQENQKNTQQNEEQHFIPEIEIQATINRPSFKAEHIKKKKTGFEKALKSPKTIIALLIYGFVSLLMFIVITPNYYCIADNWEIFIIVLIYISVTTLMFYYDTYSGQIDNIDAYIIDWWTLDHIVSGCMFGVTLPFAFMQVMNIGWEILEMCTKGIGDSEIMGNRIVDAIAVNVGWFIVIVPMYLQGRMDIFPWYWGPGCLNWPYAFDKIM